MNEHKGSYKKFIFILFIEIKTLIYTVFSEI